MNRISHDIRHEPLLQSIAQTSDHIPDHADYGILFQRQRSLQLSAGPGQIAVNLFCPPGQTFRQKRQFLVQSPASEIEKACCRRRDRGQFQHSRHAGRNPVSPVSPAYPASSCNGRSRRLQNESREPGKQKRGGQRQQITEDPVYRPGHDPGFYAFSRFFAHLHFASPVPSKPSYVLLVWKTGRKSILFAAVSLWHTPAESPVTLNYYIVKSNLDIYPLLCYIKT